MRHLLSLLLTILLLPHPAEAQEQSVTDGVVLSDDTEVTYVDDHKVQYDRHRRIQVLRDGAFGGARRDSIIALDTTYQSSDYRNIDIWEPQCSLPVRSASFTLTAPQTYHFEFNQNADASLRRFAVDTIRDNALHTVVRHHYECRDLQPLQPDSMVFNIEDYAFKMKPLLKTIEYEDGSIEDNTPLIENIDEELMGCPFITDCFNNPSHPIGAKVKQLKDEGKTVYPILLRRRSSGRLAWVRSIDSSAFDDMVLAVIDQNDTTFIDPGQPYSLQHIIRPDLMSVYSRLLYLPTDDNTVKTKKTRFIQTGSWVNLFYANDYRIQSNVRINLDHDASLHVKQNSYYRSQAWIEKGRTMDSTETTLHVPVMGDTLEVAPMSFIDLDVKHVPDSLRSMPAEFPYMLNQRYNITFRFDPRYKVKRRPSNAIFITPDKNYYCQVRIYEHDNQLDCVIYFSRTVMLQYPSGHKTMHEFYDKLHKYFAENVVFECVN